MSTEDVRDRVSEHYARRVTEPRPAAGSAARGATAVLAGYAEAELPEDAPSFGCGNPLAFSQLRPGQVVLDLGSGAGIDLVLAAGRVGEAGRVIGVDMTDAMIERARANARQSGHANIEVRKGYVEKLPVESSSVDWVISNCVVNLSPDKPAVFAEIARVLAPGGHMQISDMVVQAVPAWLRRAAALFHPGVAGAISEEAYLAGLRAAGLSDVEVVDRLVYSASQLASIAGGELPDWVTGSLGFRDEAGQRRLARVLRRFEGRVWSAQFRARK
jgi:SAM-dependent methyltransferase